jgi:MoxR-like ATPase
MKIEIGYPDAPAEKAILARYTNGSYRQAVAPVLSPEEVVGLQEESRRIHVSESLVDYMIRIVNDTRHHPEIQLGVSPRGTAALFRASQALALVSGRDFVVPDDVKGLAAAVLAHRLVLIESGRRHGAALVLDEILNRIPVPA